MASAAAARRLRTAEQGGHFISFHVFFLFGSVVRSDPPPPLVFLCGQTQATARGIPHPRKFHRRVLTPLQPESHFWGQNYLDLVQGGVRGL